ncbi:hypothetical protein [Devosia sp.]|uniref:hypothetical protein n=1 Tax=Devosia sp. TaxID=1871048 RepID=UPI002FCC7560
MTLVPTTTPKLGHLYFSGTKGQRPAFRTSDGAIWYELCYDDFRETAALKDLSAYIAEDSVTMAKGTGTLGVDAGVGLPFAGITGTANLGAKQTYTVDDLRLLSITDAGIELVNSSIGDKCRAAIAGLESAGTQIVLLTSAQRADKVSDVTNFRGGVGTAGGSATLGSGTTGVSVAVSGPGTALGGSFGSDYQYSLVYFTGLLGPRS